MPLKRLLRKALSCLIPLLGLLPFSSSARISTPEAFTIVLLPDTQYYSARHPEIFESQTRWISRNLSTHNIKLVLGLGDIVDDGRQASQWAVADRAIRQLDGKVPYFLALGNHDYDEPFAIARFGRLTKQYNRYFGPVRQRAHNNGNGYIGPMDPESTENFYSIVNISGKDFLILALEFVPRDNVLSWAGSVLRAHQDKEAIVIMHAYMNLDDTPLSLCDAHAKESYGLNDANNGDEMWEKLVRHHANIRMVISGHISSMGPGKRADLGDHGNLVNQILVDYQNLEMGGSGWLRLMQIDLRANAVRMSTFSPWLAEHPEKNKSPWWRDAQNEFVLDYANPGTRPLRSLVDKRAVIRGRVKAASLANRCAGIPQALVRYPGGSTLTDANGDFEIVIERPSSAYVRVPLTAHKNGWAQGSAIATAKAGSGYIAEIYLNPH